MVNTAEGDGEMCYQTPQKAPSKTHLNVGREKRDRESSSYGVIVNIKGVLCLKKFKIFALHVQYFQLRLFIKRNKNVY